MTGLLSYFGTKAPSTSNRIAHQVIDRGIDAVLIPNPRHPFGWNRIEQPNGVYTHRLQEAHLR